MKYRTAVFQVIDIFSPPVDWTWHRREFWISRTLFVLGFVFTVASLIWDQAFWPLWFAFWASWFGAIHIEARVRQLQEDLKGCREDCG